MGAYSSLEIEGIEIFSDKHGVDARLAEIFRDADFVDSGPLLTKDDDEEYPDRIVQLQAPVATLRDRLDIMGYTRAVAVAEFERGRLAAVQRNKVVLDAELSQGPLQTVEHVARLRKGIGFYESLTFDSWMEVWREIRQAGGYWAIRSGDRQSSERTTYFVNDDDSFLGLNVRDDLLTVRLILEAYEGTTVVVYDLSELVVAGEYGFISQLQRHGYLSDIDAGTLPYLLDDLEDDSLFSLSLEHKLVVLTEGHSDVEILKGAVAVLYPHLVDYISFLDFELAKAQGGAGTLVTIVKALAGIGLLNRFVAVFDNDTAARDALRPLDRVNLPENIRVVRLPDIEVGTNYPTIGPTDGVVAANVNGLAGTIELYLGRDVLTGADGHLTPVQWLGYNQTQRAYNGALLDKANIQYRFREKVTRCLADRASIQADDWRDLKSVVDTIRRAFE